MKKLFALRRRAAIARLFEWAADERAMKCFRAKGGWRGGNEVWNCGLVLVLAAWLALCGVANAQLSGGVGGFPGPGTAHTAASAPAYTYIGAISSSASGAGISQAFNLGSNSTCKVVVGVSTNSGTTPTVTVTVGATALVQDVVQSNTGNLLNNFIFSKDLSGAGDCNGSKTVAMTSTAGVFTYRSVSVYVLTNTVTSTVIQTGGYVESGGTKTPTSPTINVTTGDLMLAAGRGLSPGTLTTCAGSSVAPNTINAVSGGQAADFMADWVIASSNASFATVCSSASSSTNAVAFATYR